MIDLSSQALVPVPESVQKRLEELKAQLATIEETQTSQTSVATDSDSPDILYPVKINTDLLLIQNNTQTALSDLPQGYGTENDDSITLDDATHVGGRVREKW